MPCSAFSPASIHTLVFPTTTLTSAASLVVTWLASSESWSSQTLPSQQNKLLFKEGFFFSPHSHPFKVPDISTCHGKVVIWGVTNCRKKLPITLNMTVPLLVLKEFQTLFLVCSFYPDVWSSTFPHAKVLLSAMCISNLRYFIIPYSNSVPPLRYSCTLVTKIRISEHSVQYTQLQCSKWWQRVQPFSRNKL